MTYAQGKLMDAKLLRRAAEIIDQGFCQHTAARDAVGQAVAVDCPHATQWCAWGAVSLAAYQLKGNGDVVARAYAAARALAAVLGASIAPWNDAPGRTADEVAGVMRQAAARLESAS